VILPQQFVLPGLRYAPEPAMVHRPHCPEAFFYRFIRAAFRRASGGFSEKKV